MDILFLFLEGAKIQQEENSKTGEVKVSGKKRSLTGRKKDKHCFPNSGMLGAVHECCSGMIREFKMSKIRILSRRLKQHCLHL